MDMNYNVKGFKSPEDKRDVNFGKITIPEELPNEFLPKYENLEVFNQGQQPACGGYSGAWLKALLDFLETGTERRYSPRFVYSCCKILDNLWHLDGTNTRAIGKALCKYGVCDEGLFKSDVSLDKANFKDFSSIPNNAFENAQPRIAKSYAFVGTGIEEIKQAIYKQNGVILLIAPFFKGYTDGHFVVANGWIGNKIRYTNSFGRDWGDNGYGWWEEGTHQKIWEAMTLIDLPDNYVNLLTSQLGLLRKLTELLIQLKGRLK
jgi:hypothetical protein